MEESELTTFKEGLKERLKEFFLKEGFKETEIDFDFNGKDDFGNRIVSLSVKASNQPYSEKKLEN